MDWTIAAKIARDFIRLDRINYPRAKILTVAHDLDRSFLYRGRWYSPLIDTIEDDLRRRGVECISVSRIISRIKGKTAYGNVLSPEGSFARALVVKRLLGLFHRTAYPYSNMEEKIWGHILDKTGAQKVFGIQPSRELCVACHKRGVWVADIQHGVISESHPWYGEQFRGNEPVEYLPYAFFCWDKGSQQVIDHWAHDKGISAVVTGNRWIARFLKRDNTDSLVEDLFSEYEKENIALPKKPTILVTLSWGSLNIPNGIMHDELRNIIRRTATNYRWLVRLHPNQINGFSTHEGKLFKEYFKNNLDGFAEWRLATTNALPIVLHHCDLHISWCSSVAIEAAQMGIRSALLDPGFRSQQHAGYYKYYRDLGMIDLLEATESAIHLWVERNLNSKTVPESFASSDNTYDKLLDFLAN
jgi:hypothetical protein